MDYLRELQTLFESGDFIGVIHYLNLHYFFRIVIASVCGFLIGMERKNRAKEAGIRTHCIVACAAALMMIVSKYAYFDLISGNVFPGADVRLDPSRVASTIVSGIGFLGAGMIFVQRQTVTGLTTAAGIWATAGIGMAIGGGMYAVGIFSTILILVIQIILHKGVKWSNAMRTKTLRFEGIESLSFKDKVSEFLLSKNIHISDVYISRKNGLNSFDFIIEIPADFDESVIISEFDCDCSIKTSI